MKKYFHISITSVIWSIVLIQSALANTSQCLIDSGSPNHTTPLIKRDLDCFPIYIRSDKVQVYFPEKSIFSGNVNIEQGKNTLKSDQMLLYQLQEENSSTLLRTITAIGNVKYSNHEMIFQGSKAWLNLNTNDSNIYQGYYQMIGRQGRGNADIIKQRGNNRYTILKHGTFTSCPPDDNSWNLSGSKIIHDRQDQITEIWNARFKIGTIPVFYMPYLKIPLGEKRCSGFLMPNTKYRSKNGFELSVPYYFNLTNNYCSTIIPTYMSKRGIKIHTECRYTVMPGEGLVAFNWLPNKKICNKNYSNEHNLWLFHWKHDGIINKVWNLNFNCTKINKLNDFHKVDYKYHGSPDRDFKQKLVFCFSNKNWNAVISDKQFPILDANKHDIYHSIQQLSITYYKHYPGPFDVRVCSQLSKFRNINHVTPNAIRLNIEPKVNVLLNKNWGRLNTEAKLVSTFFHQKTPNDYNNAINRYPHVMRSAHYILPILKTDGKIVFERNISYIKNHNQTLEPWFQYLYIPYNKQHINNLFNTTNSHIHRLFYNYFYSGLDQILSDTKLEKGITMRIYDDQQMERFKISIGRSAFFLKNCTSDIANFWNDYNEVSNVIWLGKSYLRINNQFGIRSSIQYTAHLNTVSLGCAILEYRQDENHVLQLNYRYANPKYTRQILSKITNTHYQQGISQIGCTGIWSFLDNHCSLVGSYYYDNQVHQVTEHLVGIQYNTCCWTISVDYNRQLSMWKKNINHFLKYEHQTSFKIALRGLGKNHSPISNDLLTSNMIPYQSVF